MIALVSLLTQIHLGQITEALTVNLPAFLLSKSVNPDPVRALRFLEAFSGYFISNFAMNVRNKSLRKIKNPASSAGHSHLSQVALREARQISSLCS